MTQLVDPLTGRLPAGNRASFNTRCPTAAARQHTGFHPDTGRQLELQATRREVFPLHACNATAMTGAPATPGVGFAA
jgi:hypothetical protein